MNPAHAYQILVDAYWQNPNAHYMARALSCPEEKLAEVKRIIKRHLYPTDFIRMAEEVADALATKPLRFTLNGEAFEVAEGIGGWYWSTRDDDSGRFYATRREAQQAALDYVAQQAEDARAEAEDEENDRQFGTMGQQVEQLWKATRL